MKSFVAASHLGVSPATVGRMIERGELPAYQFASDAIRIDVEELKTLWDKSRVKPLAG